MKPVPAKGLYAITDCVNLTTAQMLEKSEIILRSGATILQYRNKHDEHTASKSAALALKNLCDQYNVPLVINDDVDLALAINADGVHLGRDDCDLVHAIERTGNKLIIGVSCYNELDRALAAAKSGASYIAFGAFFPTRTKNDTSKATPDLIRQAKQKLKIPVVAIGGITPENGKELIDAGADFLAVISGVYASADPEHAVHSYLRLFKDN